MHAIWFFWYLCLLLFYSTYTFFDWWLEWMDFLSFLLILLPCLLAKFFEVSSCPFWSWSLWHGTGIKGLGSKLLRGTCVGIKLGCFWNFCRSPSRSRSPEPSVSLVLVFIFLCFVFFQFSSWVKDYCNSTFIHHSSRRRRQVRVQKGTVQAEAVAEARVEAGASLGHHYCLLPMHILPITFTSLGTN